MTRSLLIAAPLFALAACNMQSDDPTAAKGDDTATASANAEDLTPEEAGIFDKLINNGEPLKLAVEHRHRNGGVLRINSIQVKPTETVLNVTYINGHPRDIQLNQWSNSKYTYLLADDRKFVVSPPMTNDNITISGGATMTGDLVFLGAVPQTSQLQFVVNERGSDSEQSSNPKMVVDVPVTTAAWSDDGSKKNLAA